MRFGAVLLIIALSSCGEKAAAPKEGQKAEKGAAKAVFRPDGQLANLTGLYESGPDQARSQLCVVEAPGEDIRFAMVLRRDRDRSCSGGGTVKREGETLRFTMAGESACTFEAELKGHRVGAAAAVPSGCAYYCTVGTSLAGADFTLVGASLEDAGRARDLVGEPLCGSLSPAD